MKVSAVPKIATKNPIDGSTKLELHISHQPDVQKGGARLIDFSERKLKKILKGLFSSEKRTQVATLIDKYVAGRAAVGWKGGAPVYVEVQKER